jgi:hypothetical protein
MSHDRTNLFDNIIAIFSAFSCCLCCTNADATVSSLLLLSLQSTPTLLPLPTIPLFSTPTTKRYHCCQRQQQNVTAVVNANNKTLPLLSLPTTKRYHCCQLQRQNPYQEKHNSEHHFGSSNQEMIFREKKIHGSIPFHLLSY